MPDDLIDFTPELRAQAKDAVARYKTGPMFLPPVVGDANGLLGAMNLGNASGGTNWPGAGYDPETHIVYAQAHQSALFAHFAAHAAAGILRHSLRHGQERHRIPRVSEGPGFGSAADAPQRKPRRLRRARSATGGSAGRRRLSPCRACRSSSRPTA